MALSMGSLGLLQSAAPTAQPFNFNNGQPFASQNLPWQQNNQLGSQWQHNENDPLWKMIQQNSDRLQTPFGSKDEQRNIPAWAQGFAGQQNQDNKNGNHQQDKKSQNQTNGQESWGKQKSWLEELFENNAAKDGDTKDQKDQKDQEEKAEKEKEQMEEMQEQLQEWLEAVEEDQDDTKSSLQLYSLLLLPFFMFDAPTARYFSSAELLSTVLTNLGVNDDDNLLFLLFVQCIDIIALSRGRFKLVEGYQQNWYQELYDYMLTKMNIHDAFRLGTQLLMPQSPAPNYELR